MSSEKVDSDASTALSSTGSVTATGVSSCKAVTLNLTLSKPKVSLLGAFADTITCTVSVKPTTYAKKITFAWTPTDGVEVYRLNTLKMPRTSGDTLPSGMFTSPLYVKAKKGGTVKFTLAAPQEAEEAGPVQKEVELTIEATSVAIKAEDGGEPAGSVLAGKTRVYTAVMSPDTVTPKSYEWTRKNGAGIFDVTPAKAKVTVTPKDNIHGGSASLEVRAMIGMAGVSAVHPFKIVTVDIMDGDRESKPAKTILRGTKKKFAAVTEPDDAGGTFAWAVTGGHISCAGSTAEAVVEISGDSVGAGQELKLTYTLDGQSTEETIPLAVEELGIVKKVVFRKLNRTAGETAVFNASGATEHLTWTTANTIEAAIEGKKNTDKQVKLKSMKSGIAPLTLTWKPPDSQEAARTVDGAAVFVDAWLTGVTCEAAAKQPLTITSSADDKKVALLLGHSADPANWKLGRLVVEAEGAPASVDTCGTQATGTWAWTAGTYVRAAAAQPDAHGADKAAFALAALPKTADSKGPSVDTTEAIKVKYKLDTIEIEDTLNVTVRTHGCSRVHWVRKGAANVTTADQPEPCPHKAAPERAGVSDAISVGDSSPFVTGHQHGGTCPVCSQTGARTVNHYVKLTATALTRARDVADAVVPYVKGTANNARYPRLLTAALKTHLKDTGKMLGVLRGFDAQQTETWLYALSGKWKAADGDWCKTLAFNKTTLTRTIPSYAGSGADYKSAKNPLATIALDDPFGKLGLCAAPTLLNRAAALGLHDLELAEVWVYIGGKAQFTHKNEIGSCAQCRRFLGRMLCEVGDV